jgi:hypothetical protein
MKNKVNKKELKILLCNKNTDDNFELARVFVKAVDFKYYKILKPDAFVLMTPTRRRPHDMIVAIDSNLLAENEDIHVLRALIHEFLHVILEIARRYLEDYNFTLEENEKEEEICDELEAIILKILYKHKVTSFPC